MKYPQNSADEVRFVRPAGIPFIEVRYSHYSRDAFHKHTHDTYSIGIITEGITKFALYSPSPTIIPATKKDLVLINPGQVHSCNPQQESGFTYYMLYIDPGFVESIYQKSNRPAGGYRFDTSLVREEWLFNDILEQARILFKRKTSAADEQSLITILTNIFYLYGNPADTEESTEIDMVRLEPGLKYLLAHLSEEISLETLANQSGLSQYYFVRAFHHWYGLPPHSYQLQQRIHLAKQRLREGKRIAEVAAETGFADQSHFARKFKALVGTTPGCYRQNIIPTTDSFE